MAIKVVVVVRRGIVEDCYAEVEDVEIEVIDFDSIDDDGADAVVRVKEVARTMHRVYY